MAERSSRHLSERDLLATVSNEMAALQKQYAGKGPLRARTYWAGTDTLLVMFGGGFTIAEQTMYEGGEGAAVRTGRQAFQSAMRDRMTELVEGLVGRTVIAFMSTSHQEPDLSVELFVFEPLEPDHPVRAVDPAVPPSS